MNIHYDKVAPENRDDAEATVAQIRICLSKRDVDHIESLADEAGLGVPAWIKSGAPIEPHSISDIEQMRLDKAARDAMR